MTAIATRIKKVTGDGPEMDESVVDNPAATGGDGLPAGKARRTRVAVGFDDGSLQSPIPEGGLVKAAVKDPSVLAQLVVVAELLAQLLAELVQKTEPSSTQTIAGTVAVANFPPSQAVTGPLTDGELRASPPAVRDDYDAQESLAEQPGAGGVLDFPFTGGEVSLVIVTSRGADLVAHASPTADDVPTSAKGTPCFDSAPTYIPCRTSAVKVYAPVGTVINVVGLRRA